ncbi:unnamed protein product [Orchesella dallaii]|uniref:C2H2-type domain-containing protein n=1 Tax=Orchesella dallaii TaxID=48710 RepID=A0ABP1QDX5_9HEXA
MYQKPHSTSMNSRLAAPAPSQTTPPNLNSQGQSDQNHKQLRCLFCLDPVKVYNPFKICRKVLRSTGLRMFEYVCSHLDIQVSDCYLTRSDSRNSDKNAKQGKLIAGYLPLCQKCWSSYYDDLYHDFVAYENIVASMAEKISKYVTKPIAVSATARGAEVDWNDEREHEMMSSILKIREKVLEKNVMGHAENSGDKTGESGAVDDSNSNDVRKTQPSKSSRDPEVVVVPQNSNAQLPTEYIKIEDSSSESEFSSGDEEDEDEEESIPFPSVQGPSSVDYTYMVKKAAPGVIHIIPTTIPKAVVNSGQASASSSSSTIRSTAAQGSAPRRRKKKPPCPPQFAIIETFDGDSQKLEQKRIRVLNKRRTPEEQLRMRICKFCNQTLPSAFALVKHEVTEHGKLKPEKCDQCDYRCLSKCILRKHMETHLDETERVKPFHCDQCVARFTKKVALEAHIRTHRGEKPYSCDICSKSFSCKESVKLCMDKHNGVMHHECPWCQKRFLRKEVLSIHIRTHTGEKPFICTTCDKRFAQRSALRMHLKVHDK